MNEKKLTERSQAIDKEIQRRQLAALQGADTCFRIPAAYHDRSLIPLLHHEYLPALV
jgi:hypothetical protein